MERPHLLAGDAVDQYEPAARLEEPVQLGEDKILVLVGRDDGAGTSWRRYLMASRVLGAMARLTESDESVTAVALAVGFESVASFSRAFKEVAGQSPSAYRARARRR